MTLRTMDEWAVRKLLKAACDRLGSMTAFGDEHDIETDDIRDVIRGDKFPDWRICKALGLYRVTRYARERKKGRAA